MYIDSPLSDIVRVLWLICGVSFWLIMEREVWHNRHLHPGMIGAFILSLILGPLGWLWLVGLRGYIWAAARVKPGYEMTERHLHISVMTLYVVAVMGGFTFLFYIVQY